MDTIRVSNKIHTKAVNKRKASELNARKKIINKLYSRKGISKSK